MTQEADEAAMRKAFEQFMVSGKKKKGEAASPSKKVNHTVQRQEAKLVLKKVERKYWQILNAFQGTLERDWLEVDDNLERVVSSIAELRRRIAMESRQLRLEKSKAHKQWEGYGYRVSSYITTEDLELALSHDLLQHEKLMAGARMLLASLSEAQEALGRRLEEMMLHHMDSMSMVGEHLDPASSLWTTMGAVDGLQHVHSSLAMELYRKQLLVQSLLDAVNDDLLGNSEHVEEMDANPRRVADKCSREWPRGSKASHINVAVLEELLNLGERGEDGNNEKQVRK